MTINTNTTISNIGKGRMYSLTSNGGSLILAWGGDAHGKQSKSIITAKEAKRFLRKEEGLLAIEARAWASKVGLSL